MVASAWSTQASIARHNKAWWSLNRPPGVLELGDHRHHPDPAVHPRTGSGPRHRPGPPSPHLGPRARRPHRPRHSRMTPVSSRHETGQTEPTCCARLRQHHRPRGHRPPRPLLLRHVPAPHSPPQQHQADNPVTIEVDMGPASSRGRPAAPSSSPSASTATPPTASPNRSATSSNEAPSALTSRGASALPLVVLLRMRADLDSARYRQVLRAA